MGAFLTIVNREIGAVLRDRTIVIVLLIQLFIASFSSALLLGVLSVYDPETIVQYEGGSIHIGIVGDLNSPLPSLIQARGLGVTPYASLADAEAAIHGISVDEVHLHEVGAIDSIIDIAGVVFGLPSLRLRGLYLAVSTLALHFVVIYLGGEYETKRGFSTGILVEPPSLAGFKLSGGRFWYFTLLAAAAVTLLICINLLRSRSGRAFRAVHARETVAEALGISIAGYKLLAFVISSSMTSVAGCLFAYYRGFVSVEAFDLFLSIQYVAMIIIGGMGSLLGALLGAAFVTLFPYAIEALLHLLPNAEKLAGDIFAVNYASFGVVMILFLVFEPLGLVGIWHRLQNYFLLWPFKYRPLAGARK